MSYLNIADDIVKNTSHLLSDVMDSKFATYLQGNGTPVLVTYYNIDDTLSTTDLGNYTVDQVLGGNSPLRYNKINNLPLVGLSDLIPAIENMEGDLMDMSLDKEVTLFPNTIKPTPLDLIHYKFLNGNSITFRVNELEFSSIKNNNFYRLQISLKDINDTDTVDKAEKQVIKVFTAKLDSIGTQDRCIIEDEAYKNIEKLGKVVNTLIGRYMDTFFDDRYKCLVLRDSQFAKYTIFDPYLSTFIERNGVMDRDKDFRIIANYDHRECVPRSYRRSIFFNIENKNIDKMYAQYMEPSTFRTLDSNPFYYYGEETVFTLNLYDVDISETMQHEFYGDFELFMSLAYPNHEDIMPLDTNKEDSLRESFDAMMNDMYDEEDYEEEEEEIPEKKSESKYEHSQIRYIDYIHNYLTNEDIHDLFTEDDIYYLTRMDIEYNFTDFIFIPQIIFILKKYIVFLQNEYN